MPRTEEKYIVALDIGTSKVCVLVGEVNDRKRNLRRFRKVTRFCFPKMTQAVCS